MDNDAIAQITCEELKLALDTGQRPIIIDTRHRKSFGKEHIPGAVNIPYDIAGDPMERQMMLASLPGDRLIVIYCDWADDAVSASMAREMIDQRFDPAKIKTLTGGFSRWLDLEYDTV